MFHHFSSYFSRVLHEGWPCTMLVKRVRNKAKTFVEATKAREEASWTLTEQWAKLWHRTSMQPTRLTIIEHFETKKWNGMEWYTARAGNSDLAEWSAGWCFNAKCCLIRELEIYQWNSHFHWMAAVTGTSGVPRIEAEQPFWQLKSIGIKSNIICTR